MHMPISLLNLLKNVELAQPLQEGEASQCAVELSRLSGAEVYPRSISAAQRTLFFLGRTGLEKHLCVLSQGPLAREDLPGRSSKVNLEGQSLMLTVCPANGGSARTLRTILPFLVPRLLGLCKSVGCGDRLGLATPGHVRAVRRFDMSPIFAQQSIRENARTGRTPQQVMDEAMWGVLQEGWRGGFGADADHLKTAGDVDQCAAAGYTFYTFDPGEHVDNAANNASSEQLQAMAQALPWQELESSPDDLIRRLGGRPIDLGDFKVTITGDELMRAAAKYGRAVAHTVKLYRHLASAMNGRPFELEMSVDETDTVTTLAEHIYIASELRRLNVRWVSLAPRYVGTFEKGVDYIGDLGQFEASFAQHAAVARTFGPYKLSLHSGSDKFSVYPIASRLAGDLVHLKTAGTSYLEALRAIATLDPALFREIVRFAIERYPVDRASYHVSADQTRIADLSTLNDGQLGSLLEEFHAREVLHVTFGSVLKDERFNRRFFAALHGSEETYYHFLENHFVKHIAPFAR
jgi:hypothetical protein